MSKETPTPRPWTRRRVFLYDENGDRIAHFTCRPRDKAPKPNEAEANCELSLRAINTHDALMELYAIIHNIRIEQTSDDIFGGKTTEARRAASEIYASRIRGDASKIDNVLADIETALYLTDTSSEKSHDD